MTIPHFRDEYRLIYPVLQGIPLLGGMTWWPYPRSIRGDGAILPDHSLVGQAMHECGTMAGRPHLWQSGRVQLGPTHCNSLLVVQKWPQNTLVHLVPIPQQVVPPGVQRGMMKEMQLDASAPWDQLLCEKWHGIAVSYRIRGTWEQHGTTIIPGTSWD
jgi:hypothetical protein